MSTYAIYVACQYSGLLDHFVSLSGFVAPVFFSDIVTTLYSNDWFHTTLYT